MVAEQPVDPARARAAPGAHGHPGRPGVVILLHRAGAAGPLEIVADVDGGHPVDRALHPIAVAIVGEGSRYDRRGGNGSVERFSLAQLVRIRELNAGLRPGRAGHARAVVHCLCARGQPQVVERLVARAGLQG